MATFHVVIHRSGPDYDRSLPLEQQSGWDEHAAFMDGLVDQGFMRETLARDPWSGTHLVVDSVDAWTLRLDARRPAGA